MTNNPTKCPHCKKIFFNNENIKCPFCNKDINILPDFFGDIFGNKTNPLSDMMNQGE